MFALVHAQTAVLPTLVQAGAVSLLCSMCCLGLGGGFSAPTAPADYSLLELLKMGLWKWQRSFQ